MSFNKNKCWTAGLSRVNTWSFVFDWDTCKLLSSYLRPTGVVRNIVWDILRKSPMDPRAIRCQKLRFSYFEKERVGKIWLFLISFGQLDTVLAGGPWVTFSECLKLCSYQFRLGWGNCWAICKCLSQKQKITAKSSMLRFFLRSRQTSWAPCIWSNFWTRGPFEGLKKKKIIRI